VVLAVLAVLARGGDPLEPPDHGGGSRPPVPPWGSLRDPDRGVPPFHFLVTGEILRGGLVDMVLAG
jgi:hypothetical protein